MDKILIKNALFLCNVGISAKEIEKRQKIFVDVEMFSNKIGTLVDYSKVYNAIKKTAEGEKYKLIEFMAEEIAKEILGKFNVVEVLVRIKKPNALRNVEYAAVEIIRKKLRKKTEKNRKNKEEW